MLQRPLLMRLSNSVYSPFGGSIGHNYDLYLEQLYKNHQLRMVEEENNVQKDIETFGEYLVMTVTYETSTIS